jgi:two-component system CheB/CheR fusion protein
MNASDMSSHEMNEAILAAIVQGSDDAIFSKTLDAVIMSWNPGAERLYGYTAAEAIGQPVSILLPEDRPEEIKSIMARIRQGERVEHYETFRKHKHGHFLDVSLTVSPIRNRQGNLVGASTIARDMTAQRHAENALRGAEKLAAMGRMAASIAHEIRNPLDVAKNLVFLLTQKQGSGTESAQLLDMLNDQLTRVTEICNRTLSFARQGKEVSTISITGVLDDVLALMHKDLVAKHVNVERRFDSAGEVIGYPGPLRQVCVNLITNALDALPTEIGGRVVLHVADVRHPSTMVEGVRISVCDDGSGIKPEHRRDLFQPFFSTKHEKGTGLGLWVSSGIVTQHGGTIRLRSCYQGPRTGTCFSVFLPKLSARERHQENAA